MDRGAGTLDHREIAIVEGGGKAAAQEFSLGLHGMAWPLRTLSLQPPSPCVGNRISPLAC